MTAAVAIAAIAVFVLAFWKAGIVAVAQEAIAVASRAARVVSSRDVDDDVKEKEARKAALALFLNALSITWRSALVLLAMAVPVYAADAAGWAASGDVIDFLSRWDVILVASLVMIVAYVLVRRTWPTT